MPKKLLATTIILTIIIVIAVESSFAQTSEPSVPGSPGVGGFSVLFPSNVATLGAPLEMIVVAFYPNGYPDTSFTGHVYFSASKGTISPSMSGAFVEGSWRGLINMSEAGFDIVVYVNDGNGHTGKSTPISVYQPTQNPSPAQTITSTPTSTQQTTSTPHSTTNTGNGFTDNPLLIGYVVGVIALVAIAGTVVYFRKRKGKP